MIQTEAQYRADWQRYIENVRARLDVGHRVYGGASTYRPSDDLITEIQQELEDVAGWSMLLWSRLERLRERVARAPAEDDGA